MALNILPLMSRNHSNSLKCLCPQSGKLSSILAVLRKLNHNETIAAVMLSNYSCSPYLTVRLLELSFLSHCVCYSSRMLIQPPGQSCILTSWFKLWYPLKSHISILCSSLKEHSLVPVLWVPWVFKHVALSSIMPFTSFPLVIIPSMTHLKCHLFRKTWCKS